MLRDRWIDTGTLVHIHNGYYSIIEKNKIDREIMILENIISREITTGSHDTTGFPADEDSSF